LSIKSKIKSCQIKKCTTKAIADLIGCFVEMVTIAEATARTDNMIKKNSSNPSLLYLSNHTTVQISNT
jgi:hypothetical protein